MGNKVAQVIAADLTRRIPVLLRVDEDRVVKRLVEVKNRFNAKTRNMPFDQTPIGDTCVCCGKKATKLIYFGKQY